MQNISVNSGTAPYNFICGRQNGNQFKQYTFEWKL